MWMRDRAGPYNRTLYHTGRRRSIAVEGGIAEIVKHSTGLKGPLSVYATRLETYCKKESHRRIYN